MLSTIEYTTGFIDRPAEIFNALWEGLAWERRGNTPRREYYANDVGVPYTYGSGAGVRTYEPNAWSKEMLEIRSKLEERLGVKFEVCFLNGYENSKDALGWHADDSAEMDDARPIAIVTLGAEREINFCPITMKNGVKAPITSEITKLVLKSGSLCLMKPGMQDTHMHKIPRAGFECGPRISLTFRGYVPT